MLLRGHALGLQTLNASANDFYINHLFWFPHLKEIPHDASFVMLKTRWTTAARIDAEVGLWLVQVFRDERSAPVAASLEEILGCRSLLAALQTCMCAKQNRPPQLTQPAVQLLGDTPNCTSSPKGVLIEELTRLQGMPQPVSGSVVGCQCTHWA